MMKMVGTNFRKSNHVLNHLCRNLPELRDMDWCSNELKSECALRCVDFKREMGSLNNVI